MKKVITLMFLAFCAICAFAQDYLNPNLPVDTRVADLLSRMTLAEKIGQMVQAEKNTVVTGDLANYCLGSLLSGASSKAGGSNAATDWANMYDAFQQDALAGRLKIPIIYGVDAIHGFGNVYGATVFPHNIGLGATRDPDLLEQVGQITAREVAATGVDWTFGPCVTVPRDERWGRTYEGFGEDPQVHDPITRRYVIGLQGANLDGGERILATAKHWIGDGGTANGTDRGNTTCTEAELRAIHMPPYLRAMEGNVGSFMISYSSWNGTKMHAQSYLITNVLKNELGFTGFIVSDYDGILEISGTFDEQVRISVNAGIDMFMIPSRWKQFITSLQNQVNGGQVSQSRIDDAVRRILKVKLKMGLFEKPLADRTLLSSVGSQAHRDVARKAVRESLVLLKNSGILPLSKNTGSIFVCGKNANDIGNQCGGWTISWQGASGATTTGTTILDGIRSTVSASTTVDFSATGTGASGHDVAIAVIGETPYAEGQGYASDLALASADVTCLNNVASAGIPVVVVLVSGRPRIVTSQLANWNAFVAAWLPGTEGRGVSEVLFGDYDFTGKLPCTWPREMSQIPINVGDGKTNALFDFGFGLSYGAATIAPTAQPTEAPTPNPTIAPTPVAGIKGDVNGSGAADIVDALLIAQYYVGLNPANFNPANADVNCSGGIDIVDALLVAQYYVGTISAFPC